MGEDVAGGRPAVFLDRDGVINARRLLLVRDWGDFRFRPGVLEALARLAETPHAIVVTTNQGAVGWGWIREDALESLHARMREKVEDAGGRLDGIYACKERGPAPCKKPRPGMLEDAADDLDLHLGPRSWMVGDKGSDCRAARAVGVRPLLVNPHPIARLKRAHRLAEAVFPGLPQAVEYILGFSDDGGTA